MTEQGANRFPCRECEVLHEAVIEAKRLADLIRNSCENGTCAEVYGPYRPRHSPECFATEFSDLSAMLARIPKSFFSDGTGSPTSAA